MVEIKEKALRESYESGLPKDDPSVNYELISTTDGKFCGNCRFWEGYGDEPFGACSPVKGELAQEGVCDLWNI